MTLVGPSPAKGLKYAKPSAGASEEHKDQPTWCLSRSHVIYLPNATCVR